MNENLGTKVKREPKDPFPLGTSNAFYFQYFNTTSFSTIVGVPTILFFKELGASATILGVVGSLAPFLIILQIPASRHVELVGYKRFVLSGWFLRTIFSFGLALAAFIPAIDNTTRMILAIFFLIGYNILRGISTCGFMPWMTQLIPEKVRGRFLATDQITGSIASLVTTLLISWWLNHHSGSLGFACVFFYASIAGLMSLRFLKKIPDVPVPPDSRSTEPIPWKELLAFQPFIKIITMNVIFFVAIAGGGLFWVPLVRDQFHKDSSFVLNMAAVGAFFGIIIQFLASRLIDRAGSKPPLSFGILMAAFHFFLWSMLAAEVLPFNYWSLFFIQLTAGLSFPLFNLANTRLVMATVPVMARSHYFAVYSVALNLTLGIFPWIWGIGVDYLQGWHQVSWNLWHWNAYSFFFLIVVSITIASWFLLLRIEEPKSMSTEEFIRQLLVKTPKRAITRLLNRRISF